MALPLDVEVEEALERVTAENLVKESPWGRAFPLETSLPESNEQVGVSVPEALIVDDIKPTEILNDVW